MKADKTPIIPSDDRYVIVHTNLVPKNASKIVTPENADKIFKYIFRIEAVGLGQMKADGTRLPMQYKVGDLVLVNSTSLPKIPFGGVDYLIVREFEIMALVRMEAVEEEKE